MSDTKGQILGKSTYMESLRWANSNRRSPEQRSPVSAGRRNGKLLFLDAEFVWDEEKFWRWILVMVAEHWELAPPNRTFKNV